ncbi:hypothetical protein [Tsuneonella sp. HG222]
MIEKLKLVWAFLVKSSADPRKASLAVMGFGAMFMTAFTAEILPAIRIFCEAGYLCGLTDPGLITTANNLIELAGDIVFLALMGVSIVAAFIGTVRKAWTLLNGTNPVVYEVE